MDGFAVEEGDTQGFVREGKYKLAVLTCADASVNLNIVNSHVHSILADEISTSHCFDDEALPLSRNVNNCLVPFVEKRKTRL